MCHSLKKQIGPCCLICLCVCVPPLHPFLWSSLHSVPTYFYTKNNSNNNTPQQDIDLCDFVYSINASIRSQVKVDQRMNNTQYLPGWLLNQQQSGKEADKVISLGKQDSMKVGHDFLLVLCSCIHYQKPPSQLQCSVSIGAASCWCLAVFHQCDCG